MQRNPQLCFEKGSENRAHHADDLAILSFEQDGAAQNIRIAQIAFATGMTEDDDGVLSRLIFSVVEDSSDGGVDARGR